ncbi:MAG TPA: hypothetical protein VFB27_14590 [Opitutaceae bacterium]|nr:hypothetical protein [Opitutaceae bacterium]
MRMPLEHCIVLLPPAEGSEEPGCCEQADRPTELLAVPQEKFAGAGRKGRAA